VGRLVGDAPDDDIGVVVVAAYHIGELLAGILVGVGIGPCDGPVTGYLLDDFIGLGVRIRRILTPNS
jgi:hypothetical protein